MATRRMHTDVRDNGLTELQTRATAGELFVAVVDGDASTYENAQSPLGTATGMRVSDEVALTAGDLTLQDANSETGDYAAREILVAAQSSVNGAVSSSGTPDRCIVLYSKEAGVEKLLTLNDETSDQVLTSGNTVNIPAFRVGMNGTVANAYS